MMIRAQGVRNAAHGMRSQRPLPRGDPIAVSSTLANT
jgi:hypothetical protein